VATHRATAKTVSSEPVRDTRSQSAVIARADFDVVARSVGAVIQAGVNVVAGTYDPERPAWRVLGRFRVVDDRRAVGTRHDDLPVAALARDKPGWVRCLVVAGLRPAGARRRTNRLRYGSSGHADAGTGREPTDEHALVAT